MQTTTDLLATDPGDYRGIRPTKHGPGLQVAEPECQEGWQQQEQSREQPGNERDGMPYPQQRQIACFEQEESADDEEAQGSIGWLAAELVAGQATRQQNMQLLLCK